MEGLVSSLGYVGAVLSGIGLAVYGTQRVIARAERIDDLEKRSALRWENKGIHNEYGVVAIQKSNHGNPALVWVFTKDPKSDEISRAIIEFSKEINIKGYEGPRISSNRDSVEVNMLSGNRRDYNLDFLRDSSAERVMSKGKQTIIYQGHTVINQNLVKTENNGWIGYIKVTSSRDDVVGAVARLIEKTGTNPSPAPLLEEVLQKHVYNKL